MKGSLFEIKWGSFEDMNSRLLLHPTKTEKDFRQDVRAVLEKIENDFDNTNLVRNNYYIGCSDIGRSVVDALLDMGYLDPDVVKIDCGWNCIMKQKDFEVSKIYSQGLRNKILEHNQKISKR